MPKGKKIYLGRLKTRNSTRRPRRHSAAYLYPKVELMTISVSRPISDKRSRWEGKRLTSCAWHSNKSHWRGEPCIHLAAGYRWVSVEEIVDALVHEELHCLGTGLRIPEMHKLIHADRFMPTWVKLCQHEDDFHLCSGTWRLLRKG